MINKDLESDLLFIQGLGPRNSTDGRTYAQLRRCEEWIKERWESQGYAVKKQTFSFDGREYSNLEIEIQGDSPHQKSSSSPPSTTRFRTLPARTTMVQEWPSFLR